MRRLAAAFLVLAIGCLSGCDTPAPAADEAGTAAPESEAGVSAPKKPAPDPFVESGAYRALKGR